MADYVTKIRTSTGDKQIDYNALANLPNVATLGSDGKVSVDQLPSMDYIPTFEKGAVGGVATLDSEGKVPSGQLPDGEIFLTTITLENGVDVADHTHAEIYAAYQAGKLCVCCVPRFTNECSILNGVSSTYATFSSAMKSSNSNSVLIHTVRITSADEVTVSSFSLGLSDSVTSTSTTTAASSAAVKSAYDRADSAYSKANSAYNLADAKPSKTSGTPTVSQYQSYPAPTLSGGTWERIGNFVVVALSINTNLSQSDGSNLYYCRVDGLPAPKYISTVGGTLHNSNNTNAVFRWRYNAFLAIEDNSYVYGSYSLQFVYLAA